MARLIDSIKGLFAPKVAKGISPVTVSKDSSLNQSQAMITIWGSLLSLPEPDEILKKAGLSRAKLRIMLYDDEIYGAVEKRRGRLNKTPWRLEIKEGSNTSEDAVTFITEQFETHMEDAILGAWDALLFGYSVLEVVYSKPEERGDGLIGFKDISRKPFEWFRFNPNTFELVYYDKMKGGRGEVVDSIFKFFLTRNGADYIAPRGEALLSRLYWPWFFRQQGWRFYMQWLERFPTPTTIVKAITTDVEQRQELADALVQAVQDSIIVVGKDDEVDFLETKGKGDPFEKMENLLTRRIQKLFHGANLSTEINQAGGNRAATEVHREESYDKRDDDIRMVNPTLQNLANSLTYINFPGMEPPKVVLEDEAGLGLDRATRDSTLMTTGQVRLTKDYFLKTYDYEDGDIEIVEGQEGNDEADNEKDVDEEKESPDDKESKAKDEEDEKASSTIANLEAIVGQLADKVITNTIQSEVDELSEALTAQLSEPIDKDLILEAISKSRNQEELQANLERLADGVDLSFHQNLLGRAFYTASVVGFVDKE